MKNKNWNPIVEVVHVREIGEGKFVVIGEPKINEVLSATLKEGGFEPPSWMRDVWEN